MHVCDVYELWWLASSCYVTSVTKPSLEQVCQGLFALSRHESVCCHLEIMVCSYCPLDPMLHFTSIASLCSHTQVVDTPYICDPNRYSEEEQRQQVAQWKEMTSPGPSAILLVHNGKGMFTTQHNDDYQKLKTLWGEEDFCRRLIVIFTFTDKRHALYPGKSLEEQLETTVPNLKRVLHDAGNCYIEVNNRASQEENGAVVKEILDGVERKGKVVQYVQLVMLSSCLLNFLFLVFAYICVSHLRSSHLLSLTLMPSWFSSCASLSPPPALPSPSSTEGLFSQPLHLFL